MLLHGHLVSAPQDMWLGSPTSLLSSDYGGNSIHHSIFNGFMQAPSWAELPTPSPHHTAHVCTTTDSGAIKFTCCPSHSTYCISSWQACCKPHSIVTCTLQVTLHHNYIKCATPHLCVVFSQHTLPLLCN